MALETVAVIYGILSGFGLLMSAPLSQYLFEYLQNNFGEEREFLYYAGLTNAKEFKQFFEQTLKYVILPFSLGATIPVLLFKYREYSSKNKGQRSFEKACVNHDQPLTELIPLLREALYYGGSSMRMAIYGHHLLHKYVPYLNLSRPSRKRFWGNINIMRNKIVDFFYSLAVHKNS
ncbi:hypothetical protein ACTP13_09765 [Paenibacillus peoriae]|uniref:hypothetical protein n=1 Tax=Paenibacillus peoriae TaxID=59893 RepID=UPI003F9CDD0D